MTLYIIGNGFDQHHDLPTGVDDFINFINENDIDENYYISGVDWNQYEEGLSCFDLNEISEQFIRYPDYLSDRESDRDGVIFEIQQRTETMKTGFITALNEMIDASECIIEKGIVHIANKKAFSEKSLILSFNYTSTIESLYELNDDSSLFHIHGFYLKKESLVFGYSQPDDSVLDDFESYNITIPGRNKQSRRKSSLIQETMEDEDFWECAAQQMAESEDWPDYYVQKEYEELLNYYLSNKKNVRLEELQNWIEPYIGIIDKVVVLGHSMGMVDKPYFELIDEKLNPQSWVISQYSGAPDMEYLSCYSFIDKISFCDINDYLS